MKERVACGDWVTCLEVRSCDLKNARGENIENRKS